MSLTRKRTIALGTGIAVFVVAFGVALAGSRQFTHQVSLPKPGSLEFVAAAAISGDNIMLWDSADRTTRQPLVEVRFTAWHTVDPVRALEAVSLPTVWIDNVSPHDERWDLWPVDPCREAVAGGQRIGRLDAKIWDEVGQFVGWACGDNWHADHTLEPGEVWKMELYLQEIEQGLDPAETYSFPVLFGAVASEHTP